MFAAILWHGHPTSASSAPHAQVEAVPNSRASPLADALLEALLALPHLGTLKLLWHSCDPSRTPLLKAQGSLGGLPLFQLKAGLEASRFAPCFKVSSSGMCADQSSCTVFAVGEACTP